MSLNFYFFLSALISLSLVLIAALVITKNGRNNLNRVFALLIFFLSSWIITNYFSNDFSLSYEQALIFNHLVLFFSGMSVIFLVKFCNLVSGDKLWVRPKKYFSIISYLGVFFALTPLVVLSIEKQEEVYAILFGPFAPLYFSVLLINIVLLFLILVRGIRKNKGIDKLRVATIFWSLVLTLFVAVAANILIPIITGSFAYTNVGPLASIFLVIGLAYSIVKHRLFDLRLVVVRSLAYFLAWLSIILISFEALTLTSDMLNEYRVSIAVQNTVFSIIALLLAVSYQPFKKFFDSITNRLFYRDAYETQDLLNEFNQVIVSTIDLNQLLSRAGVTIEKYLKPETVAFALRDSDADTIRIVSLTEEKVSKEAMEQIRAYVHKSNEKLLVTDVMDDNQTELKHLLQESNIGILARITTNVGVEGNGYIVMGYKKTGNMYNTQDTGVMEIIANELAIAMQNALQFEEIQRFNVTLQNTVEEKTRQLRKSNEKLKQMDETKDEFISMASHQLRTPLTSVKGYVSMVIEGDAGELNDMQKKLLDQAFVSSQRMVYLIADLLNVSRLRTGKFVIESAPTNLSDVIQGEVEQLVETAESRGLELVYQKPKDFPMLMLDETKIRQVIMNFIDNAIYYTPNGGHIKVELKDTGKSVEYTVTDDGLGVPKAQQHHLFSKFFRAENAKKARPDGTGLGLFMAKKVIVAQGGSIIFKSTEGKGSTFGFSFDKAKMAVPDHYEAPEEINGIKFGPNDKPSP